MIALGGSVLAVALPAFVRNLHASQMAEPLDGLERLAGRASQLADMTDPRHAYPDSAPLTPAAVPAGTAVLDAPGTWNHPTWRILLFSFEVPHRYSFQFDNTSSEAKSSFSATARGDLDGDGVLSTFQLSGHVRPAERPVVLPLEVVREVE